MRKLNLITFVMVLTLHVRGVELDKMNVKVSKHAIGLRMNTNINRGLEFSYQRAYYPNNRLELDLALGIASTDHTSLSGSWQWLWQLSPSKFILFAGPAGQIGANRNDLGVYLGAQVGVEYKLNIPILLSLDFRPTWGIIGSAKTNYYPAIGVRYTFGSIRE